MKVAIEGLSHSQTHNAVVSDIGNKIIFLIVFENTNYIAGARHFL